MLEIEIKASLKESGRIVALLLLEGFLEKEIRWETDLYYQGVDRDFARTDEAPRLRTTCLLGQLDQKETVITYKGPKLDPLSRTRKEIETEIRDEGKLHNILLALGHKPVRKVEKTRKYFTKGTVTACIDRVEGLGEYLELEILQEDEASSCEAVEVLLHMLDRLHVPRENCTRKSYLELLLERE